MLNHLNILELSNVLAGPAVGMFFSELGANVVKIENKIAGGDITRKWKLANEKYEAPSAYFCSVNYGKKHKFLDFNNQKDMVLLKNYIKKSDVVITNFKHGDSKRFQLSYNDCKTINPKVIYAHIGGFKSNPKRVAFDVVLQAETGFLSMCGTQNEFAKMPVALIDVLAAHQIKEGILIALLKREKTGKGCHIKTTLEETAIASLMNQSSNYLMAEHNPKKLGTLHPNIAPYGDIINSMDGTKLILAIGTDKQFVSFCELIKLNANIDFNTNQKRVTKREELMKIINDKTSVLKSSWLLENCHNRHIPIGKIKTVGEVMQEKIAQQMILEEMVDGFPTKRIKTNSFELLN
ncbi:MAG: CaiB/BaiF CoA-transferase family protein [Bacteroidota bacterium]|nr:CaiB/BaiF CoA-transferase family protein [Bacteroidota bacterium]